MSFQLNRLRRVEWYYEYVSDRFERMREAGTVRGILFGNTQAYTCWDWGKPR